MAEKAQALADLQAQQVLQAQTASANWDENIQKQADALEAVIIAGKQSQANKNYWVGGCDLAGKSRRGTRS